MGRFPKLDVVGSTPFSRSNHNNPSEVEPYRVLRYVWVADLDRPIWSGQIVREQKEGGQGSFPILVTIPTPPPIV